MPPTHTIWRYIYQICYFIIGMKCAICNGELDEEHPNAHLGKHGTESNYIMTYILALQKQIEDLKQKVQQHHG
jgi:hypothetical protein